jgi:hypothetical protein
VLTVTKSLILFFFICLTSSAAGSVGEVFHQTRQAQITRGADKILTEVGTEVEMGDKIETLKGSITIVFVDKTEVTISEYSKLIIDEFVYDANSNKGKINLKAGLGKLKYTSGIMANKENIRITTPTASVSVRGTDFETTVNEAGSSTFTLLPSIAADGSTYVGVIEVFNATGAVVLDTAFEVTTVSSSYTPPTPPVINRARLNEAIEKRDNQNEEINETESVDDEELDLDSEKDALDESLIQLMEEDNSNGLFYEEDDKAIFESVDGENKVKLIVDKDSNVSLKYDNKGVITEGNHNSGGNVIINIIQQ